VSSEETSDSIDFPAFVLCNKKTRSPFVIRISDDETVTACPIFDSKEQCQFFGGGAPIPLVMLEFDTPAGLYDYALAIREETDAECVLLGTEADPNTGLEFKGILDLDEFVSQLRESSSD
jgi:hypothetical protein